ncbi:MAG: hypothetical protein RLZZ303_258 [Candidatus Hydrogenedentota bacterium]
MSATESIRRDLLRWYEREARDLPWRRTRDPYRIWISEIILQQTRVDQGLPYYERFVEAFPDVAALAAAPLDRVIKLWEGLGYYTRARNLHLAAQRVVAEHAGQLPQRAELLQLLPGVGRYTAAAIASIAFGERVAVVDGNVKRVLARLYNIEECIDDTATDRRLWELANALVPRKAPGDFNQAMMELGARVCVPRRPDCESCPVAAHCAALREGVEAERPVRKAKAAPKQKELAAAAVRRGEAYLLLRRPDDGLLGGLWEFPAFEMTQARAPGAFLEERCQRELGLAIKVGGLLGAVKHAYTHFKVSATLYACRHVSGEPAPEAHVEWAWVERDQLSAYALHKSQQKMVALLP